MNPSIYLDNNATTRVDRRVIAAMTRHMEEVLGNPSSVHSFGRAARKTLLDARKKVARICRVSESEIFFTSGGTEGLNFLMGSVPTGTILSSDLEHAAVYTPLQHRGAVTFLKGTVTPEAVAKAIQSDTRLIVLMAVNNETGVKTDIAAIGALAKAHGIPFVVDGVAWLGKESFVLPDGVSAIAFSAHKFHGPPGVGFVIVRKGFKCRPLIVGGEQERAFRGGTENLVGIVGLAKALTFVEEEIAEAAPRMRALRDLFESELEKRVPQAVINGKELPRISNVSNVCFRGVDGETLLTALDMKGVAASHGSACSSGALEPSRVLRNLSLSENDARSSLRFSLSRMTTEEEIRIAVSIIEQVLEPI